MLLGMAIRSLQLDQPGFEAEKITRTNLPLGNSTRPVPGSIPKTPSCTHVPDLTENGDQETRHRNDADSAAKATEMDGEKKRHRCLTLVFRCRIR